MNKGFPCDQDSVAGSVSQCTTNLGIATSGIQRVDNSITTKLDITNTANVTDTRDQWDKHTRMYMHPHRINDVDVTLLDFYRNDQQKNHLHKRSPELSSPSTPNTFFRRNIIIITSHKYAQ